MIGEIRDRETLQQALLYAQTGHLCSSTLHANNSYHALNRIINFFPYDCAPSLLHRPVDQPARDHLPAPGQGRGRHPGRRRWKCCSTRKHIAELIEKGEMDQIKEAMEKSLSPGSQSFEQALFELYMDGKVTKDEALAQLRLGDQPVLAHQQCQEQAATDAKSPQRIARPRLAASRLRSERIPVQPRRRLRRSSRRRRSRRSVPIPVNWRLRFLLYRP